VANTVRVSLGSPPSILVGGPVEAYDYSRLEHLRSVTVSPNAPLIWFFTVQPQDEPRYRVCYTMFETETLFPEFVKTINDNFHEVWVPTEWNKGVFKKQGVMPPIRVMPLGVNTNTFRPMEGRLPKCWLVSTARAGAREVPKGFLYLSVLHPSHRKGIDVMLHSFENAFSKDKDAALVLAVGDYDFGKVPAPIVNPLKRYTKKSRVYLMPGTLPEADFVRAYNACQAYFCCSRGEGWNLPLFEASSCGLPAIIPKNSAHLDYANDGNSFLFKPQGFEPWRYEGRHVHWNWYQGQRVSRFGKKSVAEIVAYLKAVKDSYSSAKKKARKMQKLIRSKYTWDHAAQRVTERILELNDL
jgi:glycosyltransferase involved in cell wall biosynthesis